MVVDITPISFDLVPATSPAIDVPTNLALDTNPIFLTVVTPEIHTETAGIAEIKLEVAVPTITISDYEPEPIEFKLEVATPAITISHYTLGSPSMTLRVVTPNFTERIKFKTGIVYAPVLTPYVLDIPPLRDEEGLTAGMYFAANAEQGGTFKGAVVYESKDSGSTYDQIGLITKEAIAGRLITALPETVFGIWDRVTTFDVEMSKGELSSVTEDRMMQGANWASVGGEIIGFTTASLQTGTTYRLSGMIRGMRDTSSNMSHVVDDPFVLLTDPDGNAAVDFISMEGGVTAGKTRLYKIFSPGGSITLTDATSHTLALRNVSPFTPGNLTVDFFDGVTEDARIFRWRRRTRARIAAFYSGPIPMMDETESYELLVPDQRRGDVLLRRNNRNIVDTNDMLTLTYDPLTSPAGDPIEVTSLLKQVGAFANSNNNSKTVTV